MSELRTIESHSLMILIGKYWSIFFNNGGIIIVHHRRFATFMLEYGFHLKNKRMKIVFLSRLNMQRSVCQIDFNTLSAYVKIKIIVTGTVTVNISVSFAHVVVHLILFEVYKLSEIFHPTIWFRFHLSLIINS